MSYADELRTNYREAHKRLWSGRYPSQEVVISLPERPMDYSGAATGAMWTGAMWLGLDKTTDGTIKAKDIILAVLSVTGVRMTDFMSPHRDARFVEARQMAAWFMRHFTHLSYHNIGRLLGNRDHSTIVHAVNRVNDHPQLFGDRMVQIANYLSLKLPEGTPFQ